MAAITAPGEVVRPPDTVASKIVRIIGKAPVHLVLALIGVLWLVPTLGLVVTSILAPGNFTEFGWWKIFSKPSLATIENYRGIFHNGPITHSLWVTAQIAIGGTILPIIIAALAAYAFAWLEFPGRDWLFIVSTTASTSSTQCSASCCSTRRSACRSRSSCYGTSSSGSRRTFSNPRGSTVLPKRESSCV
jgi:hypothetical protein